MLHGHVPPAIARFHFQPINRLPATNHLNLAIGLPLRNQEALDKLLAEIYDPASTELSPLPDAGTIHGAIRPDGAGLPVAHHTLQRRTA